MPLQAHCSSVIAIALSLLAIPISVPAWAEQVRETPIVVIFGDQSRDWVADVNRVVEILDERDRPIIIVGERDIDTPDSSTIVWFGDLSHDDGELLGVPESLRVVADSLGQQMPNPSGGLSLEGSQVGENCLTRHIDREDGLPQIAVNFSGEDPQGTCRGLTISHVLLSAGRWMRNDGTGCLVRDCAMIMFGGRK